MTRRVAIFTGACALFLASPALAHHPGGASNTGGAGPIVTISATTLEAGHGAVAFLYEYLKFGGIGDTDLIAAAGKHIHAHSVGTIQSAIASAAYGVTDDLMVSVRVPYVRRTDIREGHHCASAGGVVNNTVDFRGDTAGIGDVTLLGQWRFLNNQATRTEMAFLFGLKLPTGATNRIDALGTSVRDPVLQPGSGSLDVLLGGRFTQRFGAWSFDANVLGVLAGRGAQDINLGDRLQYNAAVSYRLIGYAPPQQHQHAVAAIVRAGARSGAASPRASARQGAGKACRAAVDGRRRVRDERRMARPRAHRRREGSQLGRHRDPALARLARVARAASRALRRSAFRSSTR